MNRKLIILVEDDQNLRQSIVLILERAGYDLDATDCVYKAIEIIKSGNYQLVISDLNMPDTDEILLPNLHGIYPYLSNVILTDQSLSGPEKEESRFSDQYLIKPIAPERLLECVGMIINQKNTSIAV
jgi:DNA-binding NtrC family response regulator